jgi:phosphate transport system substrate-binding protein
MGIKAIIISVLLCQMASARDRIRGVGTPMLFPTVMGIANELKFSKNMQSPFMEVGATGLSFQMFCSGDGDGDGYPDLVNSSREITQKEISLCKKNNIKFGKINMEYDAIVLVANKGSDIKNITDEDLFNAISGYIFDKEGNLLVNKNRKWSQIRADLPNKNIVFYGTTLTSGTYDFLKEKILTPQCKKAKDTDPLKKYCGLARMDGRYIPVPGGYSMNIQKMSSRPGAVAMVPYLYLEKHYQRFSPILLNGVMPSEKTMDKYILSRFLYVYYKKNSIGKVDNFDVFINELKKQAVSFED